MRSSLGSLCLQRVRSTAVEQGGSSSRNFLTACVRGSTQASRGRPARGGGRVSSVSIDRDCMCGPGSTAGVERVPLSSKVAVVDAMVVMSCVRGGAQASRERRARGEGRVASVSFG